MTASTRPVLLSAVQPTNQLTLGNYLGAIKNWVDLQKDYDCLFFAVDLHAVTARQDPKELREATYRAIATYIACGIDPNACTLFVQSHVPEHAELGWILTCFATMGELSRMTQFKDKSAKAGTHIPAGLFAYPTLMAADILLYGTDLVPVGEDQKQHLEITRDLAERFNNFANEKGSVLETELHKALAQPIFKMPGIFTPKVGARIMSLQNPESKMSKSDPDPNATLFLTDSNDVIIKKVKRAITDSGSEITYDESKPGVRNLLSIQSALTGKTPEELVASYAGKQYGHLKVETAEIVASAIAPLRTQVETLMGDKGELDRILKRGAERARARAEVTLSRVYDTLGFLPKT